MKSRGAIKGGVLAGRALHLQLEKPVYFDRTRAIEEGPVGLEAF